MRRARHRFQRECLFVFSDGPRYLTLERQYIG
jgi:hypothetical protein